MALPPQTPLLFHFCRVQLPAVAMARDVFSTHLERTFGLYSGKANGAAKWDTFLDNLYPLDWYVASACLEGDGAAWEYVRLAGDRADCLLIDALRAPPPVSTRATTSARCAVSGSEPTPGRGHRSTGLGGATMGGAAGALADRVFQNWHVSQLRGRSPHALPEDDLGLPMPESADATGTTPSGLPARIGSALHRAEVLSLGLRLRTARASATFASRCP